jgi:hypothetical protein
MSASELRVGVGGLQRDTLDVLRRDVARQASASRKRSSAMSRAKACRA